MEYAAKFPTLFFILGVCYLGFLVGWIRKQFPPVEVNSEK